VASAGPYANHLHLAAAYRQPCQHLIAQFFCRPDALADAKPTVSKRWRQYIVRERLVSHWHSVAKWGGCFQRRLFICQSVCLFVRTITSERLTIGWWNMVVRSIVQKSRLSSNMGVKGQGHHGQKRKSVAGFLGVVLWGAVLCGATRRRGYANGKISACCLVFNLEGSLASKISFLNSKLFCVRLFLPVLLHCLWGDAFCFNVLLCGVVTRWQLRASSCL